MKNSSAKTSLTMLKNVPEQNCKNCQAKFCIKTGSFPFVPPSLHNVIPCNGTCSVTGEWGTNGKYPKDPHVYK